MDSQESEANKECELSVTLPSPVVGSQLIPDVCVKCEGRPVPPHSLSCCWYREIACHRHPFELATVQCMSCVKLGIPVSQSFHCSSLCFLDAWKKHEKLHCHVVKTAIQTTTSSQQALKRLRSCGSWPDFSADQLHGENALVIEREGKLWIKVGSSKTYQPSMDDFGFVLRLECLAIDDAKGSQLAPVNITMTDVVITPPRCPRSMIKIGSNEISCNINFQPYSSDGLTFSVLSYNILADIYTNQTKYSYCPKRALDWNYRWQNLLQEIIEYNADILCLQEVQSDHFGNFWEPELIKRGYSAVYKKKKTQLLYTSSLQYVSDGCATFYSHERFKEAKKYELEFDERVRLAVEDLKPELKHEDRIRLRKDNVALVVVLEAIRNGSTKEDFHYRICVANTHIHADAKLPDVKLYQVAELINGLEKIAQSNIPILICGDLNSTPESDPHMFLVSGRIDSASGEENDPLGIYQILKLEHSLPLVSAYASFFLSTEIEEKHLNKMNPETREPLFTIYTCKFAGTLDYILYTADSLSVEGLLELLDSKSLGVGLPSVLWSSDHIALMASFRLKPPSTTESSPPLPQEI